MDVIGHQSSLDGILVATEERWEEEYLSGGKLAQKFRGDLQSAIPYLWQPNVWTDVFDEKDHVPNHNVRSGLLPFPSVLFVINTTPSDSIASLLLTERNGFLYFIFLGGTHAPSSFMRLSLGHEVPEKYWSGGAYSLTFWLSLVYLLSSPGYSVTAQKPSRNQCRQQDLPTCPRPLVNFVDLVRPVYLNDANSGESDNSFSNWSSRWIVSGYWRMQNGRPVRVNTHIKGPKHLPLTVNVRRVISAPPEIVIPNH